MVFKKLDPKIRDWLKKQGYLEGTLPQKMAIPGIIGGKDVLIIAPIVEEVKELSRRILDEIRSYLEIQIK